MRVTHVITRLIVGGAQENTVASVLGLNSKPGVEADLISGPTYGPEGSLETAFSACPHKLTLLPELVRPVHPWKDCLALFRLTRILRQRRPEIVHTHSGKAGILGRLAAARTGVPLVLHTIHGPSFGPFQGAAANALFRSAERIAGHSTDHFVVVADAMKRQYLDAGIGRPDMYTRVFSGFCLTPFLEARNDEGLRAKLGLPENALVVGKVARLFKLKGHDVLFAAAPSLVRQLPSLRFLLVGDGEWRARFEQRARTIGLEKNFVFAGLVSPTDVPRLIGLMDILVHLSLREGLPRALPQALAAGRPVIACDCDGAREVCIEGETGFLIPPGDPQSLTNSILRLAQNDSLRERLGRRGREFARERFDVDRMVDKLWELYRRLSGPFRSESGENASL